MSSSLVTASLTDVDVLVEEYNRCLSTLLDKHALIINKEVYVKPNTPRFTESITAAKKERR